MNRQSRDRRIYEGLIRHLNKKENLKKIPSEQMLDIGKFFLGTSYGSGTIETKGTEHLVINLRKFDCFTFVENVLALTKHLKSREKSFEAFRNLLQKIRYRQGHLYGYSSRLHYFSDWIYENQKKGILKDITAEIGGRPLKKAVDFMTAHAEFYPQLKNGATLRRMKSVERVISKRCRFFITKKALMRFEDGIRDGDIIAITTNRVGLDVQHAGLATRVKNRIHLLHASSKEGKVVVSQKTLYRYLMQSKVRSGILVARVTMRHNA